VALILGTQARSLLIGAAASKEVLSAIHAVLGTFPEVEDVVRVLTMQIGSHNVLVSGELHVRPTLSLSDAEDLLVRIDERLQRDVPVVGDTFWEIKGKR
jgi:divalent metal cation (Fe/Co/Zn/Cd) transporter